MALARNYTWTLLVYILYGIKALIYSRGGQNIPPSLGNWRSFIASGFRKHGGKSTVGMVKDYATGLRTKLREAKK